jgi:hypothetical protein
VQQLVRTLWTAVDASGSAGSRRRTVSRFLRDLL